MGDNKEEAVEGSLLRYWFYSYSYSNYQGFGYGNGKLSGSYNFFPILCATNAVKNDGNAQSVIIINFIEISKEAFDEFIWDNASKPKKS